MKKKYNLFSFAVGINLIILTVPWRVMAEEVVSTSSDLPFLYIKAINPGYKIDGVSDVGEIIELGKNSDDLISLAGVTVRYTNSSGKDIELVKFPENSYMTGENLVLRYGKSVGSELSNVTYDATLALKAGPVSLMVGEEVVDSVCWTGKSGCARFFTSENPTTLVRDTETGEFEHVTTYETEYDAESYTIVSPTEDEEDLNDEDENLNEKPDEDENIDDETGVGMTESDDENPVDDENDENAGEGDVDIETGEAEVAGRCVGLAFSEILSYFVETQTEQFVELYNEGLSPIAMDGCAIRYKGKMYPLNGEVGAGDYTVRWATDFKLTKNPTSSNVLELVDVDGEVIDVLEYLNGQKKGTAWALVGYEAEEEIWRMTYVATPGEANVYQEYRICEEGKVINEATGKCVKDGKTANDGYGSGGDPAKTCAEGQYLNPLTGRCKKIEDEAEEKVCDEGYYLNEETGRCRKIVVEEEKICAEGQYLNPLTGRCKKIEVATVKTCSEGYYLNEETGRCKKIVENDGAKYELVAEPYEEESSFVALYAVLGVVGVGVLYVVWEFRREIGRFFKKLVGRK